MKECFQPEQNHFKGIQTGVDPSQSLLHCFVFLLLDHLVYHWHKRQPARLEMQQPACLLNINDLHLMKTSCFWLAVVAEFLGTFFFILFGTGSGLIQGWQVSYPIDNLHVGLTVGLGIALMVVVSKYSILLLSAVCAFVFICRNFI